MSQAPLASSKVGKVAIIYYSMYGHTRTLAHKAVKGVEAAGAEVTIFQIPETLPEEVLKAMHAAPKNEDPVIKPDDLTEFDGYLLVIPTRYGRAVAQFSAFFDHTGGLWQKGSLVNKMASIITSTATQHGGQETTALTTIPWLAHQGIIFVPLGYADKSIMTMDEIMGGSPWGAGTFAGDGSRQPTKAELATTEFHGKHFAQVVNQFIRGKQ